MAEYTTIEEAAAMLRTTPAALYAQRYRGQPPGSLGVRVGRRILWRRSDLDGWFSGELQAAREVRGI